MDVGAASEGKTAKPGKWFNGRAGVLEPIDHYLRT